MRHVLATIGLVAAAVALFMLLLAVVPGGADASITGVQPPATGDWDITSDTTVLGEVLTIHGDIIVRAGSTLFIRNSNISMACTYFDEYELLVEAGSPDDGSLEMSDSSIIARTITAGWGFRIEGDAYIHDDVDFYGVADGLYISGDDVRISDTQIVARGAQGVYIDRADPSFKNVRIFARADHTSTGTYIYLPDIYGIRVQGDSLTAAAPTFDTVSVKITLTDTWSQSISSSVNEAIYIFGLYAYYADLGTPKGLDISIDSKVEASITFSSSYGYWYCYWNVFGIYLGGGTSFDGFEDVKFSNSTYLNDASQTGSTYGRLYNYFTFVGLYNVVSSSGSVPGTLSGLNVTGHMPEIDDHSTFYYIYEYFEGAGIYWYPYRYSAPSGDFIIENVTLDAVAVYYMIYYPEYWDLTIRGSYFMNSQMGDGNYKYPYPGFLHAENWDYDITIEDCVFYNNYATYYAYFFYLYYMYADFTMEDCNFTENDFDFYYMYYYYPRSGAYLAIRDTTFINNTWDYSYAFYMYNHYGFEFVRNTFDGNRASSYWMRLYYSYADVLFEENVFHRNSGGSYWFYNYYLQRSATFDFVRNEVSNNTFSYFFMHYYPYGDLNFNDNEIIGNTISTYLLYGYRSYGGNMEVRDNVIFGNRLGTAGFIWYYLGQYSGYIVDLIISGNEVMNNSGASNSGYGVFSFYYLTQDVTISGNVFSGNSANGIGMYYPYGYYAYRYTFKVEANEFYNNSGNGVSMDYVDNINIEISKNRGSGNTNYVVQMLFSYNYVDGPDSLIVQSNNFSNNPGGAIYLIPGHYYTTSYGNPSQVVSVKRNILQNNGDKGWSLALLGLYKRPNLWDNDIRGSAMGMYLGRNSDPRAQEFKMTFIEEVMDGGQAGVTAYGFDNIDADFQRCSMLNFSEALYAKDCAINAWYCTVPEASGKTDGSGRIFVWNNLEIMVTWANATGVDSGHPVNRATLAMRGYNGEYYGGLETDENGRLEPMLINPWTCIYGEMNQWSPFDVTILANGISTAHKVSVVGDFIAPDYKELLLIDDEIPQVLIANPQDGVMVPSDDVLTEGFLFEIGSGIVSFEGQSDRMSEEEWVAIEPGVIWATVFEDMGEGEHSFFVRAGDLSGNWNYSNVSIIVDLKAPTLEVEMQYTDGREIPYNETRKGYYVRADEIILFGSYSDDFAELKDIDIRINGIKERIFDIHLGTIDRRYELDEGFNTIVVDAIDVAGNRVIQELFITNDRSPPAVYVYSPRQNEAVSEATIDVVGLSEPGMKLEVRVEATAGTNTYFATSSIEEEHKGEFTISVELFEGFQKVLVIATDPSGNSNTTFRDVILDTVPPDFVINNPTGDDTITSQSRIEIICTMLPGGLDATTFIGGQEVPNEGVFRRFVVLQEGPNLIEILAIDPVGNEQLKVVNIFRDTVKPTLTVTMPESDYLLTNSPNVRFEGMVTGSDPDGGIAFVHKSIEFKATLVSGAWEDEATWRFDLELGPLDLEQYIEVKAFDEAGNEVVQIFHVVYDEIAPSLRLDDLPVKTESSVLTINGTTDVEISTVYLEGNPFPVIDGEFGIAWPLVVGNNSLVVEVMDLAGNSVSRTVNIEYTPKIERTDTGPETGEEDKGISQMVAWILILAAITLIVTAFVVSRQRTRGR